MSDREMSDEDRMGAAHRGGRMDPTHGIQALHCQSPLDLMMASEEVVYTEDEMRVEGMRRFVIFLFGDGRPEELCFATRRLYSVARVFFPQVLEGVSLLTMEAIFAGADDDARVVRGGSVADLLGDHGESGRAVQVRTETVGRLMQFLFSDAKPSRPELPMRRVYALAKGYFPELLGGMSLHELGDVFGEGNSGGHRARWSWRIKKLIVLPVEEAGGVAHLKYQKKESTCRKYAAAQQGNQNRKKKK
jgi:hypothetical protein